MNNVDFGMEIDSVFHEFHNDNTSIHEKEKRKIDGNRKESFNQETVRQGDQRTRPRETTKGGGDYTRSVSIILKIVIMEIEVLEQKPSVRESGDEFTHAALCIVSVFSQREAWTYPISKSPTRGTVSKRILFHCPSLCHAMEGGMLRL